MPTRHLFQGYTLDFRGHPAFEHYFGGEQDLVGGSCPNCTKSLMLHMSLDLRDKRIVAPDFPGNRLYLVYCGRCSLSSEPFCYRFVSGKEIRIERACLGPTHWDDWYEGVGTDVLSHREFDLKPLPARLQDLCDLLNAGSELSSGERAEFAYYTKRYASPECGAYPIVDTFSQIGGRTFLAQRVEDPICTACGRNGLMRHMRFLASLTNDKENDIRVSYDGVQIVFFFCVHCFSVEVLHSV